MSTTDILSRDDLLRKCLLHLGPRHQDLTFKDFEASGVPGLRLLSCQVGLRRTSFSETLALLLRT